MKKFPACKELKALESNKSTMFAKIPAVEAPADQRNRGGNKVAPSCTPNWIFYEIRIMLGDK